MGSVLVPKSAQCLNRNIARYAMYTYKGGEQNHLQFDEAAMPYLLEMSPGRDIVQEKYLPRRSEYERLAIDLYSTPIQIIA
jgi:hypothetical protein